MTAPTLYLRPSKARLGEIPATLAPTAQLLVQGGGARIALDAQTGRNPYGCSALPDSGLMSFASSTASVISEPGFLAADQLRQELARALQSESQNGVYMRELARIRGELMRLCGIAEHAADVVLAASGTDIHSIAAQLAAGNATQAALAVMVESAETGSGVYAALAGPATGIQEQCVATVALRMDDGSPRPSALIDAEFEHIVRLAVERGQRVLLVMVDHTKTGLIAPSPRCAAALSQRYSGQVEVLVDACQFRIAPGTLQAYLGQDFMVAMTGSKFLTGPSFSGALFIPKVVAQRVSQRPLPFSLSCYAEQLQSLHAWKFHSISSRPNYGLLLRWEAALAELRAFRAVPEIAIRNFLHTFARALHNRLSHDPSFETLPARPLDRQPLVAGDSWDHIQTVFPFVLKRRDDQVGFRYLSRDASLAVHRLLSLDASHHPALEHKGRNRSLASLRFQLGQPVACGQRAGVAVSALRLCVGARMIVEATRNNASQCSEVIARALAALDKTALLASCTQLDQA